MQGRVKDWLRENWYYILVAIVVIVFELSVKAGLFPDRLIPDWYFGVDLWGR